MASVSDGLAAQPIADLPGHVNGATTIAFSPDGARFGTTAWDGPPLIWRHVANRQALIDGARALGPAHKRPPSATRSDAAIFWRPSANAAM